MSYFSYEEPSILHSNPYKLSGVEIGLRRVGEVMGGCVIGLLVTWLISKIWPQAQHVLHGAQQQRNQSTCDHEKTDLARADEVFAALHSFQLDLKEGIDAEPEGDGCWGATGNGV
jgi:hypothetical protein